MIEDRDDLEKLIDETNLVICESCSAVNETVVLRECRTAYADDSKNRSPRLCDVCAADYNDYWDSLWADYYNGQRL